MNSRERIEAVYRCEEPDRVPFQVPLSMVGYGASLAATPLDIYRDNAKALAYAGIRAVERMGSDVGAPLCYQQVMFVYDLVYDTDHDYSTEYKYHPEKAPLLHKDATAWETLKIPDPHKDVAPQLEAFRIMREKLPDKPLIFDVNDPLVTAGHIRGSLERFMDMMLNKELLFKGLERIWEFYDPLIEAHNDAGADILDCTGNEDTEYIYSIEQCEEFAWPYMTRAYKKAKELGMMTYCWGPGRKSPPKMFKAGINHKLGYIDCPRYLNEHLLWPEMMNEGAELKEWLRERDIAISFALRTATGPDPPLNPAHPPGVETVTNIIQHTKLALDAGAPGGGFIFGIDPLPINPMQPDANIEAVIRVVREYGKYPFKRARKITESFNIVY